MQNWFTSLDHVIQALLATLFTWFVTLLGASVVLFFKRVNRTALDAMLGAAGGVMLAASYWSLLQPALIQAQSMGMSPITTVVPGFLAGGILICLGDMLFKTGVDASVHRSRLLVFSITLHNIPEGLSVGIAFGAIAFGLEGATMAAACMLALGIGLQNFPEGAAVSLPLMRDGISPSRAFFYGQLSGMVEPLAGVAGAILVMVARRYMPFLRSLAAGAMIYVVVSELVPESQLNRRKGLMAMVTMLGFSVMMALDVVLG